MRSFYFGWLIFIMLLFAFLTWQDWRLNKRLRSPAWWWEIAGMTIAAFGFVFRLTLTSYFSPNTRLALALLLNTLTFICFIVSRHLMHTSIEAMLKGMKAAAKARQKVEGVE
jgi:hypothetical protein